LEFSRLTFNYLGMGNRKLLGMVEDKLVDGWDDPRMPTLQGIRRRGYPPAALRLMVDPKRAARESRVEEKSRATA